MKEDIIVKLSERLDAV